MTNANTRVRKNMHGHWEASTQIDLDLDIQSGEAGRPVLKIQTSKRNSGALTTYASVSLLSDNSHVHRMYRDFSATVINGGKTRCTEKTVVAQHEAALAQLPDILAAAAQHYAIKAA